MEILAFVNQKGGVAKTTSVLNAGAALAIEGKRILLVDIDPQGSLSKCAGFRNIDKEPTTYEVIKGSADINDAIRTKNGVAPYDILPTDIRMSGAEIELISVPGRDTLLKEALENIKTPYDYILIDCSPSLNILTLMALTAATGVIIPIAAQYMPLDGMAQLLPTIDIVKKRLNKRLKVAGVIITMYDSRRSLDKEIIKAVKAKFPEETYKTIVRNNSKIAEAPTFGKDIFEYDPKSTGAEAYKEIAQEIIKKGVENG
ncbi:MAG: ParA family protein [Lachnospiraceae bacterium]|nr:ParA family protein [Lachnospiraceae bacterium]